MMRYSFGKVMNRTQRQVWKPGGRECFSLIQRNVKMVHWNCIFIVV